MTPNQLLRNHLFTVAPVLVTRATDIVKLNVPFHKLKLTLPLMLGLGGHRLLYYRASGMFLMLSAAALAFWHISKTEGKAFRLLAGVLVLLAIFQIPALADTVVTDCSTSLPYWLWVLAGCWYL